MLKTQHVQVLAERIGNDHEVGFSRSCVLESYRVVDGFVLVDEKAAEAAARTGQRGLVVRVETADHRCKDITRVVRQVRFGFRVGRSDGMGQDRAKHCAYWYATHAIEARLCNDIGTKLVTAPADPQVALRVQSQLRDFIRNGVSDALTAARAETPTLTQDRVHAFVDTVYERAFGILQALGDAEADQ